MARISKSQAKHIEETVKAIHDNCMTGDYEHDHCVADGLLRDHLRAIGHGAIVDALKAAEGASEAHSWYFA